MAHRMVSHEVHDVVLNVLAAEQTDRRKSDNMILQHRHPNSPESKVDFPRAASKKVKQTRISSHDDSEERLNQVFARVSHSLLKMSRRRNRTLWMLRILLSTGLFILLTLIIRLLVVDFVS